MATWSHACYSARGSLRVFISSPHWLLVVFSLLWLATVVGAGFMTLPLKKCFLFRFPFSRKISLVQECWKNTKLSRYCQLLSASPSESKAEEPRFVSFALFPFLVILFNPLFPLHFLLSSPLALMFSFYCRHEKLKRRRFNHRLYNYFLCLV